MTTRRRRLDVSGSFETGGEDNDYVSMLRVWDQQNETEPSLAQLDIDELERAYEASTPPQPATAGKQTANRTAVARDLAQLGRVSDTGLSVPFHAPSVPTRVPDVGRMLAGLMRQSTSAVEARETLLEILQRRQCAFLTEDAATTAARREVKQLNTMVRCLLHTVMSVHQWVDRLRMCAGAQLIEEQQQLCTQWSIGSEQYQIMIFHTRESFYTVFVFRPNTAGALELLGWMFTQSAESHHQDLTHAAAAAVCSSSSSSSSSSPSSSPPVLQFAP